MRNNKEYLKEYVIWHFITSIIILLLICSTAKAQSAGEICDAIWKAEGGEKSAYYYGIKSVNYKTGKGEAHDKAEARRICENTVRNNRRRFGEYGHREFKTFIEFLGSKYCPTKNVPEWEKKLNRNWVSNVKYFLKIAQK